MTFPQNLCRRPFQKLYVYVTADTLTLFPLQQPLGEEPSATDGPSGRHEPGHCQIQHIQPQPYQATAAEAPGTCCVHTHTHTPPTDTNKHHWHHLSSIYIREGKPNTHSHSQTWGFIHRGAYIGTNSAGKQQKYVFQLVTAAITARSHQVHQVTQHN